MLVERKQFLVFQLVLLLCELNVLNAVSSPLTVLVNNYEY